MLGGSTKGRAVTNTDIELFREKLGNKLDPDDCYSPSVHVTKNQCIGMDVGGHVIVMSIRLWHEAAQHSLAVDTCKPHAANAYTGYKFCPECGQPLEHASKT